MGKHTAWSRYLEEEPLVDLDLLLDVLSSEGVAFVVELLEVHQDCTGFPHGNILIWIVQCRYSSVWVDLQEVWVLDTVLGITKLLCDSLVWDLEGFQDDGNLLWVWALAMAV